MDYVRRCYRTKMKLWADRDELTSVRWYRAKRGAKVFTGWTRFRSNSTWNRQDPIADLGEQFRAPQTTYDRGLNVGEHTGQHFDGSLDAWEGGVHGRDPEIHTDAFGGTKHCPWRGPRGPVIVATAQKGSGWVVAIGGPAIIRAQDDYGQPIDGWNREFWRHLDRWLSAHGRNAPKAAAGPAREWLMPYANPYLSDLGSVNVDYSTVQAKTELMDQLSLVSVLYCGWTNYNWGASSQHLNSDAWDVVHEWVNRGGILVVVNNVVEYDTQTPPRNNRLLRSLNVEMEFAHGDVGPYAAKVYPLTNVQGTQTHEFSRAFWDNIGRLHTPYPSRANVFLDGGTPVPQDVGVLWSGMPPVGPWITKLRGHVWLWTDGNGTVGDIFVTLKGTLFADTVVVLHLDSLPSVPTRYELGISGGPYPFLSSGGSLFTFVQMHWTSGTPTVYFASEDLVVTYCPSLQCGTDNLMVNREHDLVTPPHDSALCEMRYRRCSSIVGGRWVAAVGHDPYQPACEHGAVGGGHGLMTFAVRQIGSGGGCGGGTAFQGRVQFGTGGGAGGGEATQRSFFQQSTSGGGCGGGEAPQRVGRRQTASGGGAGGGSGF